MPPRLTACASLVRTVLGIDVVPSASTVATMTTFSLGWSPAASLTVVGAAVHSGSAVLMWYTLPAPAAVVKPATPLGVCRRWPRASASWRCC